MSYVDKYVRLECVPLPISVDSIAYRARLVSSRPVRNGSGFLGLADLARRMGDLARKETVDFM